MTVGRTVHTHGGGLMEERISNVTLIHIIPRLCFSVTGREWKQGTQRQRTQRQ